MAKYHGQTGVVYLASTAAGTATATVGLTAWSLDRSADRVEVTSFEDTNKVFVQGKPNVEGEFSGNWDDTFDTLFDGAESSTGVKLYLYPSSLAPTFYWYGTAWMDASIEVDVDGKVGVKGTFVASSAWGRKPA